MAEPVINWKQEKGALPYFFHTDPYEEEFLEPAYKILSEHETAEVKQYLKMKRQITEKIEMCHSVWQFHLIRQLSTTHLISDQHGRQELPRLHTPLTVFLTYPFSNAVAIKIYPISRKWKNGKVERLFTVGYLFWQISCVYARLYQKHWKDIGIRGLGLSDLYFEDAFIDDRGMVKLFIGS